MTEVSFQVVEGTVEKGTPPALFPDQQSAHFAARLHHWRADRGIFLKQAATEFGVAEATWSRWENQERFPSPAKLRLLPEFIGVPICCFFYPDETSCPDCSLTNLSKHETCLPTGITDTMSTNKDTPTAVLPGNQKPSFVIPTSHLANSNQLYL